MGKSRRLGYRSDCFAFRDFIAFYSAFCKLWPLNSPVRIARNSSALVDETAGKTAKCPKCEGLAQIPADPAAAPGSPGGSSLGAAAAEQFWSAKFQSLWGNTGSQKSVFRRRSVRQPLQQPVELWRYRERQSLCLAADRVCAAYSRWADHAAGGGGGTDIELRLATLATAFGAPTGSDGDGGGDFLYRRLPHCHSPNGAPAKRRA